MYITFYKTFREHPEEYQLTFEDFLNGIKFAPQTTAIETTIAPFTVEREKENLRRFYERHKKASWKELPRLPYFPSSECPRHYSTFHIPKKSGGWREINAPDDDLKDYLTALKNYIEHTVKVLPHNAAHAYVKQRSTVTAIKIHQSNDSKWFLKLDMKNFFPSHTIEYVMTILEQIYPFGFLFEDTTYKEQFKVALKYAFLNDSLPQGTPLSPTLTNICMMPLDFNITQYCRKNKIIYTRYADDLLFSSKYKWDYKKTLNVTDSILRQFNAPFYINNEKTRFGSRNGANWNLGIMLNKDNRMTIGHKKNQRFRAALHNLIMDHQRGVSWESEDKMVLSGNISYYMSIDPDYTLATLAKYEQKYNVNIKELLRI